MKNTSNSRHFSESFGGYEYQIIKATSSEVLIQNHVNAQIYIYLLTAKSLSKRQR